MTRNPALNTALEALATASAALDRALDSARLGEAGAVANARRDLDDIARYLHEVATFG